MSYKELFSAIECNRIVIIEDDFKQGEYKKERALYDITRMAVDDRCRYLAEIESISQPLHEVLSKFLSLFDECFRFLYKGIIIKHNKTEPTYTKTSLFLCEKRRFLWPGLRKEGNLFKLAGPGGLAFFHLTKKEVSKWPMKK